MKINIGDKIITSTYFSKTENAWRIEDAILVLEYLNSRKKIVLGGDILTEKLEYNYDSWYYNFDLSQSFQYNVDCSINLATEYILEYVKANGTAFYIIFVTD